MVKSHKILHAKGLTVPHWPKEWGGADWTPVQHYIYTEELQFNGVPQPLPFNVSMCGPVVIAFGTDGAEGNASCRAWPRSTTGGARASPSPVPAPTSPVSRPRPCARATTTSSMARRPGPRSAQYADWIFCLCRTDPSGQEAARHLLHSDRHEDARHHRASDPDHGRRTRGERGVLRRRQGAGREPGRPGASRLGLRQVPARQRAHRHRPRRLLQAARAAHQGAGRRRSWPATSR